MPSRLRLFEAPEEKPPGLDAIRAWLPKPRPWLHGVWLWIRWILSGIPAAYRFLRKNWPAVREGIHRVAVQGEKVARGAVRAGHAAREIGGGIVRSTRALRGTDGKVSGATAKVREVGRAMRDIGGRLTEGGRGAAAAFSGVRRWMPSRAKDAPSGLGLLDPPEPAGEPSATPTRLQGLTAPEASGVSGNQASGPTVPKSVPEGRYEPPARPASSDPPGLSAATPSVDEDRDARFQGLPEVLILQVASFGERSHPEALRALILDICRRRDWTTPAQLARWFSMHRRSLSNRHIRPLLEAGLLERRYPDSPNTPKQAYRSRREPGPPGRQPEARPGNSDG